MAALSATLAPELLRAIEELVTRGWFKDTAEVVEEALRRYLENHCSTVMEQFVRQDIDWGLHGND
ncbi:MAG: ribbon-helix-helix domain-containing protein [bacterium]|nr:ribbon-helix-helix domain-containing protein [bacterium]